MNHRVSRYLLFLSLCCIQINLGYLLLSQSLEPSHVDSFSLSFKVLFPSSKEDIDHLVDVVERLNYKANCKDLDIDGDCVTFESIVQIWEAEDASSQSVNYYI